MHLPWFLWRRYAWIDETGALQANYAPFWRRGERQRIERFSEFARWAR